MKEKDKWLPLPDENAKDYVERVGGWTASNVHMTKTLGIEFGLDKRKAKEMAFGSKSFWLRFFTEYLEALNGRGGSRYVAVKYITRKSNYSAEEIEALVGAAGPWSR